ncbi:DsbA family protein [Streptomyces altiplanensis]
MSRTPPPGPGAAGVLAAVPDHTTGPGGLVVPYGPDGDDVPVLSVYEDPRCPYCAAMERSSGAAIRAFADDGRLRLEYHFATFLDASLGGRGSRLALGALGAAADEGQAVFKGLHEALYANQPAESDDAYGDTAHLLVVAGTVAGLPSEAFKQAVENGAYLPWAAAVADAFDRSGVRGTPSLRLNGRSLHAFDKEGRALPGPEVARQIEQALSPGRTI